MPSILQKLFGRRSATSTGGAPTVYLGAFGKHPAWNDFADDIGLETQRLIEVKRLLLQGVDVNIAQWDRLQEEQRLDAFGHFFVWVVGDGVVVGRMWASSDGKGRTRYPMVACAECSGVAVPAVLGEVIPALRQLEQDCVMATAQDGVRSAVDAVRTGLRKWAEAAHAVTRADDISPGTAAARLASCPSLGGHGRGLVSLLYRLDQEVPNSVTWGRDSVAGGADSRTVVARPAHVRVPACADTPGGAALLWVRFLEGVVSRRASILIVLPDGERWADLIVGEPTGASLYCLRGNEKGIPLTTDIPYSIDEAFARKAEQFLTSFAAAGPPARH